MLKEKKGKKSKRVMLIAGNALSRRNDRNIFLRLVMRKASFKVKEQLIYFRLEFARILLFEFRKI